MEDTAIRSEWAAAREELLLLRPVFKLADAAIRQMSNDESTAAVQWGRTLASSLLGAVDRGLPDETAAVADRAAGVDVMGVAAVADRVWRAGQSLEGGAVPVRLVVNVNGVLVDAPAAVVTYVGAANTADLNIGYRNGAGQYFFPRAHRRRTHI